MEKLTLERLRAQSNVNIERVDVPEMDVYVFVRAVSAYEKDQADVARRKRLQAVAGGDLDDADYMMNYRAYIAALCMANEDGSAFFSDALVGSDSLGQWPSRAIQRVFEVATRMNGLTKEDEQEAIKDFRKTPTSSGGSE